MVTFNGPDEFFETAAEGGNAMRLQDIDGIGPATEDKIMSVREIQSTDDITQMSADELSDKAGISRSRASTAISGLGGNPSVSKTRDKTGSMSAAGIRKRQGDFWVEYTEMDKARARNDTMSRSKEAVRMDERKRAPITTDLDQWKSAPGRWDFPGVDTPTQEPGVRPKDYKSGGGFETAEFDEQGQAEYDQPDESDQFPRKTDATSGAPNYFLETSENRSLPASMFTAEGGETPDVNDFMTFTSAADVSLSPDEAFGGVGAVGFAEYKDPNIPVQDKGGRYDADPQEEQEELDEIAGQKSTRVSRYLDSDDSPQAIADVYEGGDFDISLERFKREVRRKKRTSGLPMDLFAAATAVANERGAYPAYR